MLIQKKNHGTLAKRHRVNNISILNVGGVQVEGVGNVRAVVINHFSDHFKLDNELHPRALDLHFRHLSYREGANLVKPFTMEEVKAAVWNCDSFKCSGPDGVNFDFIKDFLGG